MQRKGMGRSQTVKASGFEPDTGGSSPPAPANDGVKLVYDHLKAKGLEVEIIQDGRIVMNKAGRRLLIEVKRSGVVFSGKEDFPDESIIFEAQHIHDKASPRPWIYVVLSQDWNSMAVVGSATSKHWTKDRMYYRCPKEQIEFKPIGERDVEYIEV
jgi:hypothetical protein